MGLDPCLYNHLNEEQEVQDDVENKYDKVEPIQSATKQYLNDDVYMAANFKGVSQNPCLYELQKVIKRDTDTE
jgi:hypothetical protein